MGDPGKGSGEDLGGRVKPHGSPPRRADSVGGAWAGAVLHLAPQVESVRGQHLHWFSEKPTLQRHHTLHVFPDILGSAGREPDGYEPAEGGRAKGVGVRVRRVPTA